MMRGDDFTFPDVADAVWKEQQKHILFVIFNVILYTIPFKSFREEFRWFNNLGFEKLEKERSYLFVSNHRDIVLDTTLLNVALFEHGLVTASAIGDNLVQRDFLNTLAKNNRNFLVQRVCRQEKCAQF
jgi:1-acyl-sn-glycerol-3-phosphate acyltransferase